MADVSFMDDGGMDFAVRCVLSGAPYATAEPGEILATLTQVDDGDPESWRNAWLTTGRRLKADADRARSVGRTRTAHGDYLRAANYLFAGNWYAPATDGAAHATAVWEEHRDCWDGAVVCWPTPAGPVTVSSPAGDLPGYWFDGTAPTDLSRPVVILLGGIETPMSDAPMTGLTDALARGYRVLLVDGPGQGAALYRRGLPLSPRWETTCRALIDFAVERSGADPERVCLMGINHGGLFAAQGATDPRVAALVTDPGVLRLVDDIAAGLPDELRELWRATPDELDLAIAAAASTDPDLAFWVAKTTDPFGDPSVAGALGALGEATLTAEDIATISCPVLVADAEDAESFAGQSSELIEALEAAGNNHVRHERFTQAEGAGADCEIGGPQIRNARVYDWLDAVLQG